MVQYDLKNFFHLRSYGGKTCNQLIRVTDGFLLHFNDYTVISANSSIDFVIIYG